MPRFDDDKNTDWIHEAPNELVRYLDSARETVPPLYHPKHSIVIC